MLCWIRCNRILPYLILTNLSLVLILLYIQQFTQYNAIFAEEPRSYTSQVNKKVANQHPNNNNNHIDIDLKKSKVTLAKWKKIFIEYLFFNNQKTSDTITKKFQDTGKVSTFGLEEQIGTIKLKFFSQSLLNIGYGYVTYLGDTDRDNELLAIYSKNFHQGMLFDPTMKMHAKGQLGDHILVDIDFEDNKNITSNKVTIHYFTINNKSILQEIIVSNVDFSKRENLTLPDEKDPTNSDVIGMQARFKKGPFDLDLFAVFKDNNTQEEEKFYGTSSQRKQRIPAYQFIRKKFFQIEPFIYYDALYQPPIISTQSYQRGHKNSLLTLTSTLINKESIFRYTPVNIDKTTFEVWLDDRSSTNDQIRNAIPKVLNGKIMGFFHKLRSGQDYQIHFVTGRLEFLPALQQNVCVYIRYTRNHNTIITSDPSATITSDGKLETFIYCGKSIQEDLDYNGTRDIMLIPDNKTHYDIYEVRSIYNLYTKNINPTTFQFNLLYQNKNINSVRDIPELQFFLEDKNGILQFLLREPMKGIPLNRLDQNTNTNYLLDTDALQRIYSEHALSNVASFSNLTLDITLDYDTEAYQLKHTQIIEDSVEVKVDSIIIDTSLYSLDYEQGILQFKDKNNPSIKPTSRVEISYEYALPGESQTRYTIGGRASYTIKRDFKLDSQLTYDSQFKTSKPPIIHSKAYGNLVTDNNIQLRLASKKLNRWINAIPDVNINLFPIQYQFDGNYRHTVTNPNIFDRAIIDDMESTEESIVLSIASKDWFISSPSTGWEQCDRAPLYYKDYRNNNSPKQLSSFSTQPLSTPLYSHFSGPYNVNEGHLQSSQLEEIEQQQALVLDFNFKMGGKQGGIPFVSIATNKLSDNPVDTVDLSQIDYIEFVAKFINEDYLSEGVQIQIDVGQINEDSNSNGKLESEDIGLDGLNNDINGDNIPDNGIPFSQGEKNKVIDWVQGSYNEDIGYFFKAPSICSHLHTIVGARPSLDQNQSSIRLGNGIVNTEDLNSDGVLSTTESSISFGHKNVYYSIHNENKIQLDATITPGDWQLVRIYLHPSQLSLNQQYILKEVNSVRISVSPATSNNYSIKGRLLIDHIKFASSLWNNKKMKKSNTIQTIDDPRVWKITAIDNFTSQSEYFHQSFLEKNRHDYEYLNGKKYRSEIPRLQETTLQLQYNFNHPICQNLCEEFFVSRIFLKKFDVSYYKKINLWVNYQNIASEQDILFIRLGSSEIDYIEYTTTMQGHGWQLISFNLPMSPRHYECKLSVPTQGCPNLQAISHLSLGIRHINQTILTNKGDGSLWVNEIFASDTILQTKYAYHLSNKIQLDEALMYFSPNIPVGNHISVEHKIKYQNQNFYDYGSDSEFTDIPPSNHREETWQTHVDILPWWTIHYDMYKKQDEIPSNNYENEVTSLNTSHKVMSSFKFYPTYLPEIYFYYTQDTQYNNKQENILFFRDSTNSTKIMSEVFHLPSLEIKDEWKNILHQDIHYQFLWQSKFTQQGIITQHDNTNNTTLLQEDDIQTSLYYKVFNLSIQPFYHYRQKLIVNKNFSDSYNQQTIAGSFYLPFFSKPQELRYSERESNYNLKVAYNILGVVQPKLDFVFQYHENLFRDNIDPLIAHSHVFQRTKNPNTKAQTSFTMLIYPSQILYYLTFIEKILFSFYREIQLSESFLPFTAQTQLFKEEFGLKHKFRTIGNYVYNIFYYPIWHGFLSRDRSNNNFSNAREYVQNSDFMVTNLTPEQIHINNQYNQSIQLQEKISISSSFLLLSWLDTTFASDLSQEVARNGNIGTLPTQQANISFMLQQKYNLTQAFSLTNPIKNNNNTKLHPYDLNINGKSIGDTIQTIKNILFHKETILEISFRYDNTRFITQNTNSHEYTYQSFILFDRLNLKQAAYSMRLGIELHIAHYQNKKFIQLNELELDRILYEHIIHPVFNPTSTRIDVLFTMAYSTRFHQIRLWMTNIAHLEIKRDPIYKIEGQINIVRSTTQVYITNDIQPKDSYILTQILDINLHRYLRGLIHLKMGFDLFRNHSTNQFQTKLFGIELGASLHMVF